MKDFKVMMAGSVILGSVLILGAYGIGSTVMASGGYEYGEHERGEYGERERYEGRRSQAAPRMMSRVEQSYIEECGSCHMAYPAGLLPPQSWQRVMNGLEDHFGENAELDTQTNRELTQFLLQASAPREGQYRRMLRNLDHNAPLRITELPHFKRIHEEIPSRLIKGNDKVGSISQCDSCHRDAQRGWFDEDSVVIPGVGRWDD